MLGKAKKNKMLKFRANKLEKMNKKYLKILRIMKEFQEASKFTITKQKLTI